MIERRYMGGCEMIGVLSLLMYCVSVHCSFVLLSTRWETSLSPKSQNPVLWDKLVVCAKIMLEIDGRRGPS